MVNSYSNSNSPGLQSPLIKEKREGRQPKTLDKYGLEKLKSVHPTSKEGRSPTGLMGMDSELEVDVDHR